MAIWAEDGARETARFQCRALPDRWHIRQYIFGHPAYDRACCTGSGARNPKSLEQGGTDAALKQRRNTWTVGVAGGQLSGTYMTLADELAEVLDDGDNLRVIPIVTYGAASNLDDLLYLRGVDVAMVQSDVFEYFRTQRKTLNLEHRIHYISRLPVSEMHVLAGADIKTMEDLRGKKVSFGPAGSASSLTGTIVFQRLGVKVDHVLLDKATALQKLKSGELAGLVRVIGKPVGFFAQIPASSGLHLVPIPFSKTFADMYSLGEADSAGGEDRHYRGAGGARSFQLAEKYRSLLACAKVYRGSFHRVGQVFGTPPPSKIA